MEKHLIKPSDVSEYSRPCDVDEAVIKRAIEEAELLDIKPKIGDGLFARLLSMPADLPADIEILMQGGEYLDPCNNTRHFAGLRRTLAYYTWARLVKTGVNRLTRFGYVQKRDEYSQTPELAERQVAYNDAFAVADGYMNDCLAYIMAHSKQFPEYTLKGRIKAYRTKFKVIGD